VTIYIILRTSIGYKHHISYLGIPFLLDRLYLIHSLFFLFFYIEGLLSFLSIVVMAKAEEASASDVCGFPGLIGYAQDAKRTMQFEMSMRTMRLEKEYEKTLSDSGRLLDGEKDRVRRMELLLLKFENETLRSQLDEANAHLSGFTGADSEACAQLQEACQEIDRLELHAQASSSEINRLKVSLNSIWWLYA
jgi:predicted RNase H-like nuclease (RuvC/YqgF family)